jgi:hypothetical protein
MERRDVGFGLALVTLLCVTNGFAQTARAAPVVHNQAQEIVGAGAVADPLIAVEASRGAIINRLVVEHGATLADAGISEHVFRDALKALRADQLLAASLVNSVAEITTIVTEPPSNGLALQRFVALTPMQVTSLKQVPTAEAYLVRDGDTLTILKASSLRIGTPGVQLVGYFAPATTTVAVSASTAAEFVPKDGSGSGSGSWIGYTAGGNQATGLNSAVAAGANNLASAQGAFVGAGTANQANGISSLVIGGFDNRAVGIDSLVGAGAGHRATGARSVIVGGGYNLASGGWSFIGGGGRAGTGSTPAGTDASDHIASGNFSTIGGGQGNRTGPDLYSTVGGGASNTASGYSSAVVGGTGNTASGYASAVAGGTGNTASASYATVGGGFVNPASQYAATVGGGFHNAASASYATVSGGLENTASKTSATVAGGESNTASGVYSFAAGHAAKADEDNCALFGLWSTFSDFTCQNVANLFRIGADHGLDVSYSAQLGGGGTRFVYIGDFYANDTLRAWNGAHLTDGGAWTNGSDRNSKENFAPIDTREILARAVALPVMQWSYKAEPGIKRIGPMAQDFYAAFGLGADDKGISTVDESGVALAAIQGLNAKVEEQRREISELRDRVSVTESLRAEMMVLKATLAELQRTRAAIASADQRAAIASEARP